LFAAIRLHNPTILEIGYACEFGDTIEIEALKAAPQIFDHFSWRAFVLDCRSRTIPELL